MAPSLQTPSRCALLSGLGAGLAAALAGCQETATQHSSSPDGTLVTDYVAATTRSPTERPPVVAPREDAEGAASDDQSTATEPLSLHVVGTEADAEAFEFADEARDAAAVRRLVAETDYDDESVLVYQSRIPECYALELNYVTRDDDGDPSLELCRVIRDADINCERDAYDHAAVFVRLPFPADGFSGYSVGSGGSCDPVPERYRTTGESA
ncbi:hypothetical protein [Halobacterium sp. CBA1126]|uniref:hypothetical protein n=1 Tax=Halobacterium sp. CBA1126 TaxID=2668074 RepID=UPI0012F7D793|nr:hypothetical protein [Halobacterium sp. CBA1126]MUV59333.1 hypothetical protein [Halobacterium sp. CBA1126]